jgi:hypothetical protein
MRARYYDPVAGRFQSQDPARNGANWFLYASSNPTTLRDYNGQVPISEIIKLYIEAELALHAILANNGAPGAANAVVGTILVEIETGAMASLAHKLAAFDDPKLALKWLGQQRQVYEALQKIRGMVQSAQVAQQAKEKAEDACALLISLFL